MRSIRLIAFTMLLGLHSADAGAQTSGASFLQITPSARSYALGMASAITALGAESIGANPANLGLTKQRYEIFTAYANLMDGTRYEHVAAVLVPQGADQLFDGLGLSMSRLESAGFEGADTLGNKTGSSFSASDMAVSVSASRRLSPSLRAGATARILQSRISSYESNVVPAGDIGLTYTFAVLARPVSLGASLTNAGYGQKFIDQNDRLPTMANLGLALPIGPVMGVVEVNRMILQQHTQASLGVEVGLGAVSFRAGFLAQNQGGNLAQGDQRGGNLLGGLSGGVGIEIGMMRLDYAMSQQAVDYGTTQRVALSMRWGGEKRKKPEWKPNYDRSDWMVVPMGSY